MFQVIAGVVEPEQRIRIDNLRECNLDNSIILAEKDSIQDILIYDNSSYQWSSLYVKKRNRSKYQTIMQAISSRLSKGMSVYVFQNRGEFRGFLKYKGVR